jgi:hypothetical protein
VPAGRWIVTTTFADAGWRDVIADVTTRLSQLNRELAAGRWRRSMFRPVRFVVATPAASVAMRNKWRPWWSVVTIRRTGARVVGFGGLLLSVAVVVPGRAV